jgi:hypothetical protein
LLSQYSIIEGYERLHAVPRSAGSEAGKYVSDAGVDGVQMLAKKNDKGAKKYKSGDGGLRTVLASSEPTDNGSCLVKTEMLVGAMSAPHLVNATDEVIHVLEGVDGFLIYDKVESVGDG